MGDPGLEPGTSSLSEKRRGRWVWVGCGDLPVEGTIGPPAEGRCRADSGSWRFHRASTAAPLAGTFRVLATQSGRRNVELKAHDPRPEGSVARCGSIGAADQGVIWQRDTYFWCRSGRLKLREERPGSPQLIQYNREDRPGERVSDFRVADLVDPDALRHVLKHALGIKVVVEKQRRLFLWETVRIHLDKVVGLGTFLEFEAVVSEDSDLALERARVERLRKHFEISEDRLVAEGYSDLLVPEPDAGPLH